MSTLNVLSALKLAKETGCKVRPKDMPRSEEYAYYRFDYDRNLHDLIYAYPEIDWEGEDEVVSEITAEFELQLWELLNEDGSFVEWEIVP